MRRLRRFQRIQRLGAAGRDLRRARPARSRAPPRPLRAVPPARQPCVRRRRRAVAQSARSPAMADRRAVRTACSRASASRIRPAPRLPPIGPPTARSRAASTASRRAARSGSDDLRFAGLSKARVGLLGFGGQPLDLGVDASQPCGDLGRSRTKLLMGRPRPLERLFGIASDRREPAVRRWSPPDRPRQRRRAPARAAAASSLAARQITLQQRQPVALLQPDGRCCRRARRGWYSRPTARRRPRARPAPDPAPDRPATTRRWRRSSTSPVCDSTRASAGGAWTNAASGVAPPGSLGAGSNGGSSRQCRAASGSAAEVSSSPKAAPSAASRPAGTLSASTIGGQRSPSFTASTSASARASAASLARVASAADCRSRAVASAGPVAARTCSAGAERGREPTPAQLRQPPVPLGGSLQRLGIDCLGADPIALRADLLRIADPTAASAAPPRASCLRHRLDPSVGLGRCIGGAIGVRFRDADCFDGCHDCRFGGLRLRRRSLRRPPPALHPPPRAATRPPPSPS